MQALLERLAEMPPNEFEVRTLVTLLFPAVGAGVTLSREALDAIGTIAVALLPEANAFQVAALSWTLAKLNAAPLGGEVREPPPPAPRSAARGAACAPCVGVCSAWDEGLPVAPGHTHPALPRPPAAPASRRATPRSPRTHGPSWKNWTRRPCLS